MTTEILKNGKKVNLIFETSFINPFGVFIIETKLGNMICNFIDESEAIKRFEEEELA